MCIRDLCLGSFIQSIGAIVKEAGDVDYEYAIFLFDKNIWAKLKATVSDCLVGCDSAKSYCICDPGDKLVVTGTYVDEVRAAVVYDVGKCFGLRTVEAYGRGV